MRLLHSILLLFSLSGTLCFGQSVSPPQIKFDVPSLVVCRDITTDDFKRTHNLEKLLEVRLSISSLLATGPDRCIRELFFFVYSPERSFEVVEFSPSTTLITEFASPIDENQNHENSNNAGLTFSPSFDMAGKANINANIADRQSKSVRTSRLPPKKIAVASGTQKRGTAAYFKFKPSTQLALEGTQEITLTIKVPISWRADVMYVHCRGSTSWTEKGPCVQSRSDYMVPMCIAADAAAKIKCQELGESETKLRKLAQQAKPIPLEAEPDFAEKFVVFIRQEFLGQKKTKSVPSDWLGEMIFTSNPMEKIKSRAGHDFDEKLETAFWRYRNCRRKVIQLNH